MSDTEFAVKLKAEAHIDELAETAIKNNKPYVTDTKNHPFAKDGFEYRTAYFQDYDGQFYKLSISIGHNGNTATIYNVGKIIKSASPSANVIAVVGSTAPGETLSTNRIQQTPPGVNGQSGSSSQTGNQGNSSSVGSSYDELAAEAKTLSMERADAKLEAEDWKHIAEGIDVETGIWRMNDLARVLDSAAG